LVQFIISMRGASFSHAVPLRARCSCELAACPSRRCGRGRTAARFWRSV